MGRNSSNARRPNWGRAECLLALIFICLAAGIMATGYFYYLGYEKNQRSQVGRQLSAIADLKVGEIQQWRRDRLDDGAMVFRNAAFSSLVRRAMGKQVDPDARRLLLAWLEKFGADHYDAVRLLDAQGVPRISVPADLAPMSSAILQRLPEVLRSRRVTFQDFYRGEHDQRFHLAVLVPVLDESEAAPPLGMLVLRIDPAPSFYPFIRRWPTPSQTAETLLVRREGHEVVFLNDLRFQKNAALTLRRPLEQESLPAARAALGREGLMEGIDYRGQPVAAALRGIPDSPWFLVARIDAAEAYAPLRERLWQVVGIVSAAMFGAVASIVALWRHQRTQAYRERSEAAQALSQSEAQMRAMLDLASVGIAQADPWTGRFLRVNRKMSSITGYGTDELLEMRIVEVTHPDDQQADSEASRRVVRGEQPDYRMEKRYVRKDGTVAWVNVNMTVIRDAAGEPTRTVATVEDITERRQAGESLLASEARYRRLFEAARDGILILDAKTGMVLDVNPFLVELLDFTREQFLATPIWELGPFGDIFANENDFLHFLDEGYVRYEDKPLIGADGRRIAVEFASNVYQVDHQTVIQCNVRDNSKRQRAEDALRLADQRMRRLADSDIIGIVTADTAGHVSEANDYYLRLIGCQREALTSGRVNWRTLTPPEWLPASEHAIGELRERGTCTPYEKEYVRQDGSRVPVLLVQALLPGPEEQLVALVLDLTDRKRAENSLRQSEQRYRAVAESAPDAIVTADGDGNIIDWNPSARMMFGYTEAEACGQPITSMMPLPYRARHLHGLETVTRSGKSRSVGRTLELMGLRKDGNEFPLELSMATWENAGRRFYCGIIRDITGRRRAEKARDKLQTQLVQARKMEAVGSLAGGVAHDFNNMLTVVTGCAEIAMEKLTPADPARAEVAEILAAADRSAALVRQLLAFARKQTIAPRVLDLNDAIAPMLSMLRRLIGEDVELVWKPGADLGSVKMDPSQIGQLLANLVINARDAIAGVGRVAIETAAIQVGETECTLRPYLVPGTYVALSVSDDGCGMDEKVQAQIFEPFFSTKPRGQGTGLGLATVYGIVKQNGGFINVRSEPGQGATFALYLPAHEPKASSVTADSRGPESTDAPSGPKTVLLVEDDVALLALSRRMLERQGYTVLAASDPIEAIELLKAFPGEIHLLMTDVVMPKMNGRELQGALTALRPGLKCLFTSGYTSDVIADRGVLDEDIQFLQKPFSQMTLAAKVREAMG